MRNYALRPNEIDIALFISFIEFSSTVPIFSLSRFLSIVRTCSSRTTLSLASPELSACNGMWVGKFAFDCCNCGGDYSRTESVADIILNNKHRSDSALLRAYNGTQVGIINISSSYIQGFHAPNNCLLVFLPFQKLLYSYYIIFLSVKFVNRFSRLHLSHWKAPFRNLRRQR